MATLKKIVIYKPDCKNSYIIPLIESRVPAGFPSIAEDYIDKALDLNELLIKHPSATFFVRVQGNSMVGAGINSNDILVVDRALTPVDNKIVVARLNGEMTVKRIRFEKDNIVLVSENPDYKPIIVNKNNDFEVWGVVTSVIHQV